MLKKVLLWTLFVAFLYLAITAVTMQEYVIGLVMGVISVACLWAAPSNAPSKKASLWGAD